MRSPRNISRPLFGLTLTLIGLMSWNILPLHISGRVVEAATHTSLTRKSLLAASTSIANGKIAFVSRDIGTNTNADIYTINADGCDRLRLTFDPREDGEPAWSPDGMKIAFVRRTVTSSFADTREIYVMNADGSDQRRLTEPGANSYHYSPSWSPDGTKIAFAKFAGNSSSVLVMNADGSDQRTIFGGAFLYPSWSPDGLKIAGNIGYDGLVLINIDGSNLTHITQPPQPFDPTTYFADFEPAWSPDGSKIVFTRYVDCDINDCYTSRLYVVNSDGSNPTDLTRQNNLGFSPAWSPDGRKIVFGGGDLYVMNPDGSGLTNLTNTNDKWEYSPSWQPLSLPPVVNPIDDPEFFVRRQYLDFLGREPDPAGLAFWVGEIESCGADAQCREIKRVNVSAAFFLSIEFQQTGYLVDRFFLAAFGRRSRFAEFQPDMQLISQRVVVNAPGWEQQLESNKRAFAEQFVSRTDFRTQFDGKTNEQFVDQMFANAGVMPSQPEHEALVNGLNSGAETRATALRWVAEHEVLYRREFNPAFVLTQYFGYLRRDPDEAGIQFWLAKLNQFNGNFVEAEMVKAFIDSTEYRSRFGQP